MEFQKNKMQNMEMAILKKLVHFFNHPIHVYYRIQRQNRNNPLIALCIIESMNYNILLIQLRIMTL